MQCVFNPPGSGGIFSVRRDNHDNKAFVEFTREGTAIRAEQHGFQGAVSAEGTVVLHDDHQEPADLRRAADRALVRQRQSSGGGRADHPRVLTSPSQDHYSPAP